MQVPKAFNIVVPNTKMLVDEHFLHKYKKNKIVSRLFSQLSELMNSLSNNRYIRKLWIIIDIRH